MQTKAELVRQINDLKARVIDLQIELRDMYLALQSLTDDESAAAYRREWAAKGHPRG